MKEYKIFSIFELNYKFYLKLLSYLLNFAENSIKWLGKYSIYLTLVVLFT